MTGSRTESLLDRIRDWGATQGDIRAIALVGPHARGTASETSDIDLVSEDPKRFVDDTSWTQSFGNVSDVQVEDYGAVTSLRVRYETGLEVEFGMTDDAWLTEPLDAGTREVVTGGIKVILDPTGRLRGIDSPPDFK